MKFNFNFFHLITKKNILELIIVFSSIFLLFLFTTKITGTLVRPRANPSFRLNPIPWDETFAQISSIFRFTSFIVGLYYFLKWIFRNQTP
jgi:hypothetical protein